MAGTSFSNGTVVQPAWLNYVNSAVYDADAIWADGYGVVADGTTDDTVALQAAVTASAGRAVILPAGTLVISSTISNNLAPVFGFTAPGMKIIGAGVHVTFIDNRVANAPLFDIDSATHGGTFSASMQSRIERMTIHTTTNPAGSTGIRVINGYQVIIDQMFISEMVYGIELKNGAYADDGWNMVSITNTWLDVCTGWGLKADGTAGRNEGSFTYMKQVFFQSCGTDDGGANPPTSGAMIWKGQVLNMEQVAAANGTRNVAFYIKGDSGLGNTVYMNNCVAENTYGWGLFCTGITAFKARNTQIYNNTVFTCDTMCEFDGSSYIIRNVDWDGGVTRCAGLNLTGSVTGTVMTVTSLNSVTNQAIVVGTRVYGTGITAGSYVTSFGTGTGGTGTYNLSASSAATGAITITGRTTTAYKISGTNVDTTSCRIRNIDWGNFDFPNQTRFDGWQFDHVPNECELVVLSATSATVRPRAVLGAGNTIPYRLAGGSGSAGGGVRSTVGEIVPLKVSSSGLAVTRSGTASTTRYYCYVYDNSGAPAIELSTTAFTTDTTTGYAIKTGAPDRLYVGSLQTTGVLNPDGQYEYSLVASGWLNPTPIASVQPGTYAWMWYSGTSGAMRRTLATLPTSDTDGALV